MVFTNVLNISSVIRNNLEAGLNYKPIWITVLVTPAVGKGRLSVPESVVVDFVAWVRKSLPLPPWSLSCLLAVNRVVNVLFRTLDLAFKAVRRRK